MKKNISVLSLFLALIMLFTLIVPTMVLAEPEALVTKIKVSSKPKKTNYYYGETLDVKGLKIEATFETADGDVFTADVSNECYIGDDPYVDPNGIVLTGEGKQTLMVYGDFPGKDGSLNQFSTSFSINIYSCNVASFRTKSLSDGVVGEKYSQTVKVNDNASGPYEINQYYNPGRTNNFPKGLKISSSGKISGTPTKAGKYTFCLQLSNQYGDDYREYTIVIKEPADTPLPTESPEPTAAHEHKAEPAWKFNENTHWHECECGEKMDEAAHEVTVWNRIQDDQKREEGQCTVCGETLTREAKDAQGALIKNNSSSDNSTLYWIIGAVVLVLLAGGAVAFFLIRKQRNK